MKNIFNIFQKYIIFFFKIFIKIYYLYYIINERANNISPSFSNLRRGQLEHTCRMLGNFIQNLRGRNDLQRINSTPVLITDSAQGLLWKRLEIAFIITLDLPLRPRLYTMLAAGLQVRLICETRGDLALGGWCSVDATLRGS